MAFFLFQGTLPPPYSPAVPVATNGSLSSPVSTMTSHSSSSSLAKQRQSWLDLVSQASPVAVETAVVCSVQVHSHRPAAEEADGEVLESSSQPDSLDTESNEESAGAEEEGAQTAAPEPPEGEARSPHQPRLWLYYHYFYYFTCDGSACFPVSFVLFMLLNQRGGVKW